jgi:hypothetical protein
MSQWKVDVIQIARAEETRRLWKWTPLPPLTVLRACLKDRHCQSCRGATGPFIFIGKLPGGPYMAFRRPIQLVRNGTLGLVIQPPQESAQAQAKTPEPQPVPKSPQIIRVVDLPKKKAKKKPAKKATKPTKKVTGQAPKKAPKKPTKPAPKKTTRRRRTP